LTPDLQAYAFKPRRVLRRSACHGRGFSVTPRRPEAKSRKEIDDASAASGWAVQDYARAKGRRAKTKILRDLERVETSPFSRSRNPIQDDCSSRLVQKLWNYCTVLRDDGLSY
jgi:hypothetical protein